MTECQNEILSDYRILSDRENAHTGSDTEHCKANKMSKKAVIACLDRFHKIFQFLNRSNDFQIILTRNIYK